MSVNTYGTVIYADESLTLDDIITAIMEDDDLKAEVFLAMHDRDLLRKHLEIPGILVRTKEKDTWAMTPITCECGCTLQKGTISRHRKTKKHMQMLEQLPRRKRKRTQIHNHHSYRQPRAKK